MSRNPAAANEAAFNELASTYRSEAILYASSELSKYILKDQAEHLNPDSTILDYACGPGDVSLSFKPLVKSVTGADVSTGMLDAFMKRAAMVEGGVAKTIQAKDGQLPADAGFYDLILCTHAYHHFEDPQGVTNMLAKHLKPNGALLVAEFPRIDPPEGQQQPEHGHQLPHSHHHEHDHADAGQQLPSKEIVPHGFGFEPEHLANILKNGGLTHVQIKRDFGWSKSVMKAKQGSEMLGFMLHGPEDQLTYVMGSGRKPAP